MAAVPPRTAAASASEPAAGHCQPREISRQYIKKQRHYFPDKGLSSQSYVFYPVVMYRYKSWAIKKSEHQRIEAFQLWCWRRLLRVPWTAKISNQSILKETSPEYLLEGLMLKLKLKLQCFGHFIRRVDSLEKTLMQPPSLTNLFLPFFLWPPSFSWPKV